jgi:hypothetical protein
MDLLRRLKNYIVGAAALTLAGVIAVLILLLRNKNKKLRDLETDLHVQSAKLQLENILIRNRISAEDLQDLKSIKDGIKQELYQLEKQVEARLAAKMTAEEIVAKLKEVGLPQ